MTDNWNEDCVPGTPEERIQLVWPLTQEIVSLSLLIKPDMRISNAFGFPTGFTSGHTSGDRFYRSWQHHAKFPKHSLG